MAIGTRRRVPRHLQTLFGSGTVGDLPDGALLERFVATRDETAFEVLVQRHGPMVLRLCRAALTDPHEAEDAFQAVFLILVRRASSIRSRGSIASWLYGVASRVSARARVDAVRRRRHERAAAARRPGAAPADVEAQPNPTRALDEELARLPERYREAIVLCDLEGQTCEAVARRLSRPSGTVRARLSRARGMLKQRLLRRGIAAPAGLLAAGLAAESPAAVPASLARMTVSAAGRWASAAAPVSAQVSLLVQGVLRSMLLHKLGLLALLSMPAALAAGALMIGDGSTGMTQEPRPKAGARVEQPPTIPVPRSLEGPVDVNDPAIRALRETLPAAAKTAEPYYFTFALIRLAKARNAAGDRDGALAAFRLADQVADTVKNQHLRRLALMRTAVARGRIGDVGPARATLEHFAREAASLGPQARYDLMSMVIGFLHQAGFRAEAAAKLKDELAAVEAIADERIKDGGVYRLLYNQVELGDYEGALRQVERYTGSKSNTRQSLLDIVVRWRSSLADPFAPRRVVERALELAHEITYPYPRALAEAQIAPALARAGDIDGALRLARDIGKDAAGPGPGLVPVPVREEIPAALAEIARIQARNGDRDGARKTLREAWAIARTVSDRGVVLFERIRRIAEAAAEIGDVEAARMAADEIDDDAMEKVLALVALARARLKVGDAKAARVTLDDALAHGLVVGPRRNVINDNPAANSERALREVALALAEAGDAQRALGLVAARGSDAWKAEVRAAIAPIQARIGDIPGALATAGSVSEPGRAGEAYTEIAAIQARTSGAEPVLAWAARLESPAVRAFALIGLAEGLTARARKGREK